MKYLFLLAIFILVSCASSNQPEKSLEEKIAELVDEKIKNNNPAIYYDKHKTRLTGTYSKSAKSIIFARKSTEVEIDGRKFQKIYLANSGLEIVAPISKSYKSGKKEVRIILTVDGNITRSNFELKVAKSESDFLLGQNFIIDNLFKD